MTRVLVTHPGLQHSHQLAYALYERDMLQSFWSGVPVAAADDRLPWWLPPVYRRKVRRIEIPRSMRWHPARFQIILKAAQRFSSFRTRSDYTHRIFHWFDAWAARQLPQASPKVVVAYENAALHTFQAAKKIGARCVLDAAAFHHRTAAERIGAPRTAYTAEINRRKDAEVELADLILTCSPLAAESYVANGVPRSKIATLLLGAERGPMVSPWQPHTGPARFVFAGSLSYLKSIDLIVDAFKRLHDQGMNYELAFIGGAADRTMIEAVGQVPRAKYLGSLPQQELFSHLAKADCLLLPSRFDSFGMVVAEAMSYGTPAIVSTQTGARAMIDAFPGSGWIVPPDAEAIRATVHGLLENPTHLREARSLALEAGRAFSWTAYRKRAGDTLEAFAQ